MLTEPFIVERVIDHSFERRTPKKDLKKGQHDLCKHCGRGKHNIAHHAFPESTRNWGSGTNQMAYQSYKKAWEEVFAEMLASISLPKNLTKVMVEGQFCFGKKPSTVDQDNFRYPCSKYLGDAMVREGYIVDDGWDWDGQFWRFSFGDYAVSHDPDIWRLTLIIFAEG